MSTDELTLTEKLPEGWGWPTRAQVQHYFRAERSLCGQWERTSEPLAGNLEEPDPEDCRKCSRIGYREVEAWYAQHGRDEASYAETHDNGKVWR